jgi:hypothetical protein
MRLAGLAKRLEYQAHYLGTGLRRQRIDVGKDVADLPVEVDRRTRHGGSLSRARGDGGVGTAALGGLFVLGEQPLVPAVFPAQEE